MNAQEAAVRQEILERVRHKHQRPEWLVQNVSNKLGLGGELVQHILDQLIAEGMIKHEKVHDIDMVSIVKK